VMHDYNSSADCEHRPQYPRFSVKLGDIYVAVRSFSRGSLRTSVMYLLKTPIAAQSASFVLSAFPRPLSYKANDIFPFRHSDKQHRSKRIVLKKIESQ
jgi:hypothetical protein